MHKLSRTLAMMSLLAPMGASALGIGDIRLRSTLNQSLSAEIPLVLSGGDSLADVKVALASPEAFAKAGLERHSFLTKLRFSAVQKSDGSYAIEVSSSDVIREPFVSFLVEVNWPRGRLIREYTVLLDPPATFSDRTLVDADSPSVYEQLDNAYSVSSESTVSSNTSQPRASIQSGSSEPETEISGSEYGPVKKDSTLWEIAKLVNRDPDITQEQMLIALFRNNPQAFYGNTPDTLKAGETLKIPDREFILQFSRSQARAELARSNNSRSGKFAGRSAKPQPTDPDDASAAPMQAQLKLLAPSDSKSKDEEAAVGMPGEGGKSKAEIALEIAETLKQENDDLRSRLSALEQQLSEVHRLLTLKNEQIARLQEQQGQQSVTESAKTEPSNPKPLATQMAPNQESEEPREPSAEPENLPPAQTAAVSKRIDQTASPEAVTPAELKGTPPKPAPAPPPTEIRFWDELFEQPAYLAAGAGGLMLLGVIPWLLARRRAAMIEETESILLATEKQKLQKVKAADSQLSAAVTGSVAAAKTSFLSEFTPSDFDALGAETDEVDPISEADVYLAYGRYKQAEDLIRNAIEQYPEWDECKLKLLEIHYATENREAFERFAQELKAQGKDSNPTFWENVVEMGRELCPGNALFASALSADPVFSSESDEMLASLDLTDGLIEDLKRFDNEVTETATSIEETHVSLNFNLDTNNANEAYASAEEHSVIEVNVDPSQSEKKALATTDHKSDGVELQNLIAFRTSKLEADSLSTRKLQEPEHTINEIVPAIVRKDRTELSDTASTSGHEMFDFDFCSFAAEDSQSDVSKNDTVLPKLDNLIPFDTEKLNVRVENEAQDDASQSIHGIERREPQDQAANLRRSAPVLSTETPDLGSHLTSAVQADEDIRNIDDMECLLDETDEEYAPLTDMDQLETKLDLAKAYADMDDTQSALDMLQEVLEMGNEQQKAEAKALLHQLNVQQVPREPVSLVSSTRAAESLK